MPEEAGMGKPPGRSCAACHSDAGELKVRRKKRVWGGRPAEAVGSGEATLQELSGLAHHTDLLLGAGVFQRHLIIMRSNSAMAKVELE